MFDLAVGLGRQHLVQRDPALLEAHRRAREVQAVGAKNALGVLALAPAAAAEHLARGIELCLERIRPGPQRARVVRAQAFGIDHLQPGRRGLAQHVRHVQQLAAGKDVFLDEVAHARAELAVVQLTRGDAVVEHQPARLEQRVDLAKVGRHVGRAHVLEHAHRRDLVERLRVGQLAVVAQLHAHAALQAFFLDEPLHVRVLVLRQGDARGVHAVVLGRPHQQRAPARADVQVALAGLQHELAADVVELGFLRLRQRELGRAEVGA
ncbi:hypothetical protein D9M69_536900 [compost metagenome]